MKPYAIEGYCARCGNDDDDEPEQEATFFDSRADTDNPPDIKKIAHECWLTKNNGKFFKRITPADLARYQQACKTWETVRDKLPYPKQEIPDGQETHRLLEHHYCYWHQMFNPRQLLCLATLLKAVDAEAAQPLREMLLNAFSNMLDSNCTFAFYPAARQCLARLFTRHDFQPRMLFVENNPWGQLFAARRGSIEYQQPQPEAVPASVRPGKNLSSLQFLRHCSSGSRQPVSGSSVSFAN
ncbi:MAG: hypothetical protein ACP5MD_02780 [Verrucomicrobiia bacterium]